MIPTRKQAEYELEEANKLNPGLWKDHSINVGRAAEIIAQHCSDMDSEKAYVLLEFQSTVDYRMPLRLFFYISEILREYSKNAGHKKSDKTIRIPAVIPIVLYNGKPKWDVPTKFSDIVYNGEMFKDHMIDFSYDIFDINHSYTKEELIQKKCITSAIFMLDQKVEAIEFLNRIKDIALFFDSLTDKELQVLKHWIKNSIEDRLAETAVGILDSNSGS